MTPLKYGEAMIVCGILLLFSWAAILIAYRRETSRLRRELEVACLERAAR